MGDSEALAIASRILYQNAYGGEQVGGTEQRSMVEVLGRCREGRHFLEAKLGITDIALPVCEGTCTACPLRKAPEADIRKKLTGSVSRWWYDCLQQGSIEGLLGSEWERGEVAVTKAALHEHYSAYAVESGERKPISATEFSKRLARFMPDGRLEDAPRPHNQPRRYSLPALAVCRESFLKAMGVEGGAF